MSNLQFGEHEALIHTRFVGHTLIKDLIEGVPHLNASPNDHTFLSPVSLVNKRQSVQLIIIAAPMIIGDTMYILVLQAKQKWCTHSRELLRRHWVSKSICLCLFLAGAW